MLRCHMTSRVSCEFAFKACKCTHRRVYIQGFSSTCIYALYEGHYITIIQNMKKNINLPKRCKGETQNDLHMSKL